VSVADGVDQLLRLARLDRLPIDDALYGYGLIPAIAFAVFVLVFIAHLRAARRRRR